MAEINPIEESLNRIEIGIRQIKLQYDMFFSGVIPRQPFEQKKDLETELEIDELVATDPRLGSEALSLLQPGAGVHRRVTPGGAGPKAVVAQLEQARHRLGEQRAWLAH